MGAVFCAVSGSFLGDGVVEPGPRECELVLPRAGRYHGDLDPPRADPDQGAELQQFQADRAADRRGELGVRQADAAQGAEQ